MYVKSIAVHQHCLTGLHRCSRAPLILWKLSRSRLKPRATIGTSLEQCVPLVWICMPAVPITKSSPLFIQGYYRQTFACETCPLGLDHGLTGHRVLHKICQRLRALDSANHRPVIIKVPITDQQLQSNCQSQTSNGSTRSRTHLKFILWKLPWP